MNENNPINNLDAFEEQLSCLKSVLETEYQALLQGDAKTVASLAVEKEHLSEKLSDMRSGLPKSDEISKEIRDLAGKVDELAKLNHVLIEEIYQFYHGMLELFMRMGGRGQTYGKNGIMNVDTTPGRSREILA